MDIKQLKTLTAQPESQTVEFKKSTAQLHPAFETICAFLNGEGGTVLIGVNDHGKIIGQEVADNTRQAIANEISKLEPPVQLNVDYIAIDKSKHVIAIDVKKGTHAPYTYDGRAFQRDQSTTRRMPQQRYDQLVAHRFQHNFTWEELIAEGYSVRDLDRNAILGVVRKAVEVKRMPEEALRQSVPKILEALKLSMNGQLKVAAVVLFAREPFPAYPQCQLKLARFKGTDRHEFLDSDLIYGHVFELLEKGLQFIRKHLPLAGKIEPGRLERVENLLIPFAAIREALINTLCHRDYSIRGGSIALAIYDDRMEISNHGGLLPGVTLAQIKAGFSEPRNPLIAEVFYRCELIEKWGRGIPEIIKSCKAASDPEPEFIDTKAEFKVIFKFPEPIYRLPNIFISHTSGSVPHWVNRLTPRQLQILQLLKEAKELQLKQLMQLLKLHVTERTVRRDLAALKKLGLVEMRGHAKTAIWFLTSLKTPRV